MSLLHWPASHVRRGQDRNDRSDRVLPGPTVAWWRETVAELERFSVRGGLLGQRSVAFAGELHFTLGPASKPRRCVFAVDDIELLLLLRAVAAGLLQGLGSQRIRRFRI